MREILTFIKDWVGLLAPVTAGIGLLWKYFLKKQVQEVKLAHQNLKKVVDYIPSIEKIATELKPNGGSSLRDAINRIESKLDLHDQKILALIKQMPYGTWLSDAEGKWIDVNLQLCNLVDRTESELKGDNWTKYIKEKDDVLEEWFRCIENQIDFDMEFNFIKPDKTYIKVKTSSLQLKNLSGQTIGFVGKVEEIKI